jgi:hypothetical protein
MMGHPSTATATASLALLLLRRAALSCRRGGGGSGAAFSSSPRHFNSSSSSSTSSSTSSSSSQHGEQGALLAYDELYVDAGTLAAVADASDARSGVSSSGSTSSGVSTSSGHPTDSRGPLTAAFLHGLFGSAKNWRSFAKGLAVEAAKATHRCVFVPFLC